jgi:hypothetical protein
VVTPRLSLLPATEKRFGFAPTISASCLIAAELSMSMERNERNKTTNKI